MSDKQRAALKAIAYKEAHPNKTIAEVCEKYEITEVTYYKYRNAAAAKPARKTPTNLPAVLTRPATVHLSDVMPAETPPAAAPTSFLTGKSIIVITDTRDIVGALASMAGGR